MVSKKTKAVLLAAAVFASVMTCPISAAEMTERERNMLSSVIAVNCAGAPLVERIRLAAEVISLAEEAQVPVASAVREMAAAGRLARLDKISATDETTDGYRLSADAVDVALSGATVAEAK